MYVCDFTRPVLRECVIFLGVVAGQEVIVLGGTDVYSECELVFEIAPDIWRGPEILHCLATGERECVLGALLGHPNWPRGKIAGRRPLSGEQDSMEWKFISVGDRIRKSKSARNNLEAAANKKLREMEENFLEECRSLRYKTTASAKKKLVALQEEYPKRVQRVQEKLATDIKEKDEILYNYYIEVCALVKECNASKWPAGDFIGKIIEQVPTALFATLTT